MEMDALENAIVCSIYEYIHKKNVIMTVALKYIHIYNIFECFLCLVQLVVSKMIE